MIKHRIKQLSSLIIGILRSPFFKSQYFIRRGYRHRKKYHHFSAIGATDQCQKEVYEIAEKVAAEYHIQSIIDVGCGSGYKLMKLFADKYEFIGIDIKSSYEHLVKNYSNFNWLDGEIVDYSTLKADLVICSDVIEHVVDPDDLLQKIKSIQGLKMIVISTPDRLLIRNWFDYGPPKNTTHVREWNGKEFAKYIASHQLEIITHQMTNYNDKTQLIVCKPR